MQEQHANYVDVPAPLDSEYQEVAWGCQRPTVDGGKFAPMKINRAKVTDHLVNFEIMYSGICHSDVHVGQNDFGATQFPCVPGHEILGKVKEIGDKVTKFKVGDLVGVGCYVDSCRDCEQCNSSNENYCLNGFTGTYNGAKKHGGVGGNQDGKTWGGYAASHTVHQHYCHQIPEGLPLESVAPILCAGITMYEPLRHWGATKPGVEMVIGVAGIGGLGTMGVKIAKALGHKVVAISQSMKKEKLAIEKGADYYVASSDPESIKNCPVKCHLILNTVSADHDCNTYLPLLRTGGTLIQLGLCPKPQKISPLVLIGQQKSIAGCLIGGITATEEILALCAKHQIWPDCEVVTADKIDWVWAQLNTSNADGLRYVIDVKKSLEMPENCPAN